MSKKTIITYLRKYDATVKIVVMDMSRAFKAAIQKALGKLTMIADQFYFAGYVYLKPR
ncbi:MAG: transposase [Solibacillus sp.]